ncbi:MAG: peptidoglycan DD-metalloendopeptidase family protein [Clostridia bacterium]|nr:peptidoglycan DD-metalloendopeptidase family protein [Clostridia bacterium]
MKRKIVSIILILALIQVGITNAVIAYTQSDVNAAQNKVNQVKKQQNAIKAEKETVLNDIAELEETISEYESELAELNTKIKKLEAQIETKSQEIEKLKKEFEEMEKLLTDRLVAIYEEGQVNFLDVLLSAESIWDYISMPTRIQELTEADNSQMEKVEKQRMEVEKAQKQLEEQNTELKDSKKTAETKQKQLKVVKANKEAKAETLTAEQKKLQAQIKKYNDEIKKMEEEIAKAAQGSNGGYVGNFNGTLSWPISRNSKNYNYITSYFGNRDVPVAGATANHGAIDIGVYSGTPIYACGDGYVMVSSYNGARGVYVMIKHADNLYTLYQHLNSSSVKVGQTVKRGQLIAYSGNTGISSGPHLHLEVRTSPYYGSEVDPLNYMHW